jgi:hypothetical protein
MIPIIIMINTMIINIITIELSIQITPGGHTDALPPPFDNFGVFGVFIFGLIFTLALLGIITILQLVY